MEAKIRLIPAGAGNIARRGPSASKAGAHPRRCGENEHVRQNGTNICGSSPQVRGKQWAKEHEVSLGRLIPAGAGKTGARHESQTPNAAHPRRCGENQALFLLPCFTFGSSPQVRGKQHKIRWRDQPVRLIPAGAGKTGRALRSSLLSQAHPRRCGENTLTMDITEIPSGSSPQVRGKLAVRNARMGRFRLIPAGAGKTPPRGRVKGVFTAHPRRCGENRSFSSATRSMAGSSPQVRGKPHKIWYSSISARLIPAGAGKTPRTVCALRGISAHPRRCGENL